jgi:hypothetical protein
VSPGFLKVYKKHANDLEFSRVKARRQELYHVLVLPAVAAGDHQEVAGGDIAEQQQGMPVEDDDLRVLDDDHEVRKCACLSQVIV